MPKAHRIAPGDKIKSNYGASKGKIGTVVRVYNDPPSITAGFDPNDIDLHEFIVPNRSRLVEFRLFPGEFEPINKTLYNAPN